MRRADGLQRYCISRITAKVPRSGPAKPEVMSNSMPNTVLVTLPRTIKIFVCNLAYLLHPRPQLPDNDPRLCEISGVLQLLQFLEQFAQSLRTNRAGRAPGPVAQFA